ncbi:hypothetical protein KAR91_13335 [Candidatus Pacearchaeota archaeon]|nr:hypothetical protein [Candidatus Pacearchaeota archaeon]
MKTGNWIALDKNVVACLPHDRPFTDLEALVAYSVDLDNKRPFTISGYAKQWSWGRKKVRKFLNDLGTSGGHLAHTLGTGRAHHITLKLNNLEPSGNTSGTLQEQSGHTQGTTTSNPKPKPDTKPKDKKKKSTPSKEGFKSKRKYGPNQNIELTSEEYKNLIAGAGKQNVNTYIEKVSNYGGGGYDKIKEWLIKDRRWNEYDTSKTSEEEEQLVKVALDKIKVKTTPGALLMINQNKKYWVDMDNKYPGLGVKEYYDSLRDELGSMDQPAE